MALNQPAWCTPALLKVLLGLLALCLAGYILGPPLYWHSMEGLAAVSRSTSAAAASSSSCPACVCDCSSQPLLSIPHGESQAGHLDFLDSLKICLDPKLNCLDWSWFQLFLSNTIVKI